MNICIASDHFQNKPIKCDICKVAFPRINYLKANNNLRVNYEQRNILHQSVKIDQSNVRF